jgi:hypothetical protein
MRGSLEAFTAGRSNSLEVNMRIPSLSIPVVVLAAMTAGCAMNPSGSTTTAMGAGPAQQTVMCRDGAWTVTTAECGNHGGVERAMTPSK